MSHSNVISLFPANQCAEEDAQSLQDDAFFELVLPMLHSTEEVITKQLGEENTSGLCMPFNAFVNLTNYLAAGGWTEKELVAVVRQQVRGQLECKAYYEGE